MLLECFLKIQFAINIDPIYMAAPKVTWINARGFGIELDHFAQCT